MVKIISQDHKIINYVIIATLVVVVFIGIIVVYFLFQRSLKSNLENQLPIKETTSPTEVLPKTNPFETKTNPFKDIKTNPFR